MKFILRVLIVSGFTWKLVLAYINSGKVNDAGCGFMLSSRISGTRAKENAFSWTVPIWAKRHFWFIFFWIRDDDAHVCTGSIISSRLVLTAARCDPKFDSPEYKLSGHYTESTLTGTNHVESFHSHPQFKQIVSDTYEYDIMLLYMKTAFEFSNILRPVCICNCQMPIKMHSEVPVAGYGIAVKTTSGVDLGVSSMAVSNLLNSSDCGPQGITLTPKDDSTICYGDSGAPAMIQVHSIYYVAGVFSAFKHEGCSSNTEVYFTGVAHNYDYIIEVANRLGQ